MKHMKHLILMAAFAIGAPVHAAKPIVGIVTPEIAFSGYKCVDKHRRDTGSTECLKVIALGFAKMLETAVVKTRKMAIIERAQLDTILAEQGIGAAGITTRNTGVGGILPVDYILNGAITKYGSRDESSGIAGSVSGLFGGGKGQQVLGQGLSAKKRIAEMAVDLKIVSAATGEIVLAETVEASAEVGGGLSLAGVNSGSVEADPIADVQRKVANRIAAILVLQHFPIRIVAVKDGIAVLNYNNSVLSEGDCLRVYEEGESFTDPDTGEVLGAEETEVGELQVTEVTAKFSKAIGKKKMTPVKGQIARKC